MLLVYFQLGADSYALESREIVEIVPLVQCRQVPRAPAFVAGLFDYRGRVVPVIDLSEMAGHGPARRLMSTRILLVNYPDRLGREQVLGLMAERVVDASGHEAAKLQPVGLTVPDSPFLGALLHQSMGMVQMVKVRELLTGSVQALLFPEEEAGS